MKGAEQVLPEAVIDAGLASDRGVRHARGRRRHGVPRDAAQEDRGRESRHVRDDASPDGDERVVAAHSRGERGVRDRAPTVARVFAASRSSIAISQSRPGRRGRRADRLAAPARRRGSGEQETPGGRHEIPRRPGEQALADPDALSRAVRRPGSVPAGPALTARGARAARGRARAAAPGRPRRAPSSSGRCPRSSSGNAITSRRDVAPAAIAQIRSRPSAMPPWGGAP